MTQLYSRDDVEAQLDLDESLATVEKTYAELASGRVLNPPKMTMHLGDDGEWPHMNAFSIDMPAYVDWLETVGMKWAIATWDADSEIPISSQILLFDLAQNRFKAVLKGMYLTGVRTALQSVVGLKHLCPASLSAIGLFGAGFQAEFQVSVIDHFCSIDDFYVFDVDNDRARQFASELAPQTDADITPVTTAAEAARQDVVITATDSKSPVLEAGWLNDSAFIVALGSYQELLDDAIFSADHVVVDQTEQCLKRGVLSDAVDRGKLTAADIDTTTGSILTEAYHRSLSRDDRVLFVPIGLGALDISIAEQLHQTQRESDTIAEFSFV
jgi:ornithine cyclodeaminase/alanine dehydrogenase